MNQSVQQLRFYTTAGCHLCEQALDIIQNTLNPEFFQVQQLEIADDDDLISSYGTRIPVLQIPVSGKELGWPFDQDALIKFLGA